MGPINPTQQNIQMPPAASPQSPPPNPSQSVSNAKPKGKIGKIIALIIISILLGISAVSGYAIYKNLSSNQSGETACTMEAKICPDGSSVGRTGPNCEFAPCPTTTPTPDPTADWKTYVNQEYSFQIKYPSDWLIEEDGRQAFLTITPPGANYYASNLEEDDIGYGIVPSIEGQVYETPYEEIWKQYDDKNYCSIEKALIAISDGTQAFFCEEVGAPFGEIFIALPLEEGSKTLRFNLITTHQDNIDNFNKKNKTSVVNTDRETFKTILSTFNFTE